MRRLSFEVRLETGRNEMPLRDLDRERGRFPSAVNVLDADYSAKVQQYTAPGSISRIFGQRIH